MSEPSDSDRNMALLAHLGIFFFAMFSSGMILATKGEDSPFVRYHALQAFIYQVSFVVFAIPLAMCSLGLLLPLVAVFFIPPVVIAVRAQSGEWMGYPGIETIGMPGAE